MSDDRPVATDALASLGTAPIPAGSGRDAIHLAVEPVIADSRLSAGEWVARRPNGRFGAESMGKALGIVDPFLSATLNPGDTFWLIIPPRQITSLRHVWSHPAFPEDNGASAAPVNRSESEKWMRAWALRHVSEDYYGDGGRVSEDEAYAFALRAGREHYVGPYDDARDYIDNEWWGHWEAITGEVGERGTYFSCAC